MSKMAKKLSNFRFKALDKGHKQYKSYIFLGHAYGPHLLGDLLGIILWAQAQGIRPRQVRLWRRARLQRERRPGYALVFSTKCTMQSCALFNSKLRWILEENERDEVKAAKRQSASVRVRQK